MAPARTAFVILSLIVLAAAVAGPLSPPTGSVAPTHKTLTEVEPRTPISASTTPGDVSSLHIINQPGSYYLTGNITTSAGRNAISVNADNVTIDLNGYALDGSTDTTAFASGVKAQNSRRNVVVKNGTIRAFRGYGLIGPFHTSAFIDLAIIDCWGGQLELGDSNGCLARNVRAKAASGEVGIELGTHSVVESCTTEGSTAGITVVSGVVSKCTVLNAGAVGINLFQGSVSDCMVSMTGSTASFSNGGIVLGNGARAERCTVRGHVAAGIFLSGRCDVIGCTIQSCAKGIGSSTFASSGRARIEGNTFITCTAAISLVNTNSFVVGNRFNGNTANISAAAGNTIGEVLDFSAGGATLTGTNAHPAANIAF